MKVLVYGAGILGSYLAHVLLRGGNQTTILARGQRMQELKKDGLVIQHYLQHKTTVDTIHVINELQQNDRYDIIFVVMKYTDFPAILPILAENQSKNIILVGNNGTALEMQNTITEASVNQKNITFGFQLSGGSKKQSRIISIGGSRGRMVIGSLTGSVPPEFQTLLEQTFQKTTYKLDYLDNIDTWLKSHIVPILAMNAAIYIQNNDMKKVSRNKKLLKQMIEAANEGFNVLYALGYDVTPKGQVKLFREYKLLAYYGLKLYHFLPVATLINGSFTEIIGLFQAFNNLRGNLDIPTPNLDELERLSTAKFINEN